MPAASKFLRERGQIFVRSRLIPGIRAQRNLRADLRCADAYRVHGLRVQQIGNELVVALEIQIAYVEKDHAILRLAALPEDVDRLAVALEQRPQMLGYQRQLDHL